MVKTLSMIFWPIRANATSRAIEAVRHVPIKTATIALLLNLGGVMHTAHAAEEDTPPRQYSCSFESGSSWTYDQGKFQSTNASPLSFDVTDIDVEKQTASLVVGGKRSGTLRVVRAINGMHFIEVMVEGYMSVTTVYDPDPATGKSPAVHSRHMAVLGSPLVAQYYGACTRR